MQVLMHKCRRNLAILWFIFGFFLPFGIVLLQTTFDVYGDEWQQPWRWLLPNTLPTLSLIMTVFVAQEIAAKRNSETKAKLESEQVSRFVYLLTFYLSVLYLIAVNLAIFKSTNAEIVLVYMNKSNLWLGPIQGFVMLSLGVFFTRGQQET